MKLFETVVDESKMIGDVFVTISNPSLAKELNDQIESEMKKGNTNISDLIRRYNEKASVKKMVFKNVVCLDGKTLIAKAVTGQIASVDEVKVTHCALGIGTDAVFETDTQLEDEVYRKFIASMTNTTKYMYIIAHYLQDDVSGTFYEHGIFIDSSSTPDDGSILSHVLLNAPTGVTKGGADTLTIEHVIRLN
jgi:hypothetical protein